MSEVVGSSWLADDCSALVGDDGVLYQSTAAFWNSLRPGERYPTENVHYKRIFAERLPEQTQGLIDNYLRSSTPVPAPLVLQVTPRACLSLRVVYCGGARVGR